MSVKKNKSSSITWAWIINKIDKLNVYALKSKIMGLDYNPIIHTLKRVKIKNKK